MEIKKLMLIVILIICFGFAREVSSQQTPQQIHISYGDSHDSIVVMWSSRVHIRWDVHYWIAPSAVVMTSQSNAFILPETHYNAAKYIYRSVLKNLTLATTYSYKIVSRMDKSLQKESQVYNFTTLPGENKSDTTSRFIVYGDMGAKMSDGTRSAIEALRQSQNVDAVLHVGDFAYDLHSDGGKVGDTFMEEIQPIAAEIPYMTAPGNHEISQNFESYRTRFSTPNTSWPIPVNKMWYSFDVGLVHFISYSTEVYFTYNEKYVCQQFDWLLQDLITANQNRDKRPWIIAFGHRPMYCSNNDGDDCTDAFMRRWVKTGLESLFHAQGVDLVIEAHEHSYERLYPLFDGKVERFNYTNPRAPVHIITGAAGSIEGIDGWEDSPHHWSAFRFKRKPHQRKIQSFSVLEIHNNSHLLFIQNDASDNSTMDEFWFVQEKHGEFVANVNCFGPHPHESCFCNMPFVLLISFIITVIVVVLLVVVSGAICVSRYLKQRSKNLHKFQSICNTSCVKCRCYGENCESSIEDSNIQLLGDFDS